MKKNIFLIAILFLLLTLPVVAEEKGTETTIHPNYTKFLEKPSELGTPPPDYLFSTLTKAMKQQFYGDVTDAGIIESVQNELQRLYKAANKPDPLQGKSFTSPEAIYADAIKDSSIPQGLIKYATISGVTKAGGDPYTSYLTPNEMKRMMESLQSASFGGIGVVLELDKKNNNALTVIEPIDGTPAHRSGILSGDVIQAIDSVPTAGQDIDISSAALRGSRGSKVTLTIKRKGFNGTRKYTLIRDIISIKSIYAEKKHGDIGYIRLRTFGEATAREFKENLAMLKGQGIKGLIIDLRNNGGGYINAAIHIANMFLPKDTKIVSIKRKDGTELPTTSTNVNPELMPVVILVNKYSASASEITAGAFQENKRAILVGTKTFGKGSVQKIIPLSGGAAIKITIAHYHTPLGNDINKKGLTPEIVLDGDSKRINEIGDKQLEKAIELVSNEIKK